MPCPACGATAAEGQKFCSECGEPLASRPTTCGRCGAESAPEAKFCAECGHRLAAGPAAPTPQPGGNAVAERRVCAVLFVDLVGFTGMSEQRDVESVRELLSEYFALARRIITRYGGTLEKFIGDAVMAVWGAPVAHDDDSERAVRAGLDILEAVRGFGEERGVDLLARAGVVTDSVAVTVGAVGQGIVAGDAVNTASRVQSAAEPGSVLVDNATRAQSSAAISYVDAGSHVLKGKAEPVTLHRAVRVVAGLGGNDRVDGLEVGFRGRDRELRTLKETFHAGAESSRAALVSVTGVPGVGKTRLRWEFEKYIDGLADTVLWHDGRCPSYGDGIAYWALAQMVRRRLGLSEEDSGETAARKLEEGLQRWIHEPAEREFLSPRLGVLLGTVDPGLSREELFAGWRLWFERLAEHNPVIMVVDDLQWADQGLLDFLEHLLEWSAASRLYVLTLGRPELLDRRQGWGLGRRSVTSLALDPLPAPVMAELLDELVPGLPDEVSDRIVAAADGIPLYAVELVRSLVDQDVIRPVEGAYRLVGEVADLAVPASLNSLITARIDGLPEAERSLVARLAVLGATFPRRAVGAVTPSPDEEVDALLASLVRREVLTVRSERMSPERGQYAFTQALLRAVAYETLSRADRRARHLDVARHLRATFPDDAADMAEVVAEHYRDAWLADPDAVDADVVRREALEAYDRAAARALAIGAPESAARAYAIAAELSDDVASRAEHEELAGEAAEQAGQPDRAIEMFTAAVTDYTDLGMPREAAWARLLVLRAKTSRGIVEEGDLVECRAAAEILDDREDKLAASGQAFLANALVFSGSVDEAVEHCERALDLAQALDLPREKAIAGITKGVCLVTRNRSDEALMYYEWAIRLTQDHGLPNEELKGRVCAGDLCMISDLPGAVEQSREGIEVARRLGDRQGEMFVAGNLVLSQIFDGDWDDAQATIDDYLGAGSDPDRAGSENLHVRVALLAALRGDAVTAAAAAERMREWERSADLQSRTVYRALAAVQSLCVGSFDRAVEMGMLALQDAVRGVGVRHEATRVALPAALEAALRAGRLEEAQSLYKLVAGFAAGLLPPYLHAELAHYRARLAAAAGSSDGVEADLGRAVAELDRLGYPYFRARAQSDLGAWLHAQGRDEQARPVLEAAAATLRGLGARPALSWLESDTDRLTIAALV